jgi:hypothetical protein
MLRQLGRLRKSQSLINPIGNRDGLEKRSERCGSWSDAAKTSRWMLEKLKVRKEEKRRKRREESRALGLRAAQQPGWISCRCIKTP